MYNPNKTNIKQQLEFIVNYWLDKQDDADKLKFFYDHELHRDQLADYILDKVCDKVYKLESEKRKQNYTRKRYARDGFYSSEAYKEEAEKIKPDERYKVHPFRGNVQ